MKIQHQISFDGEIIYLLRSILNKENQIMSSMDDLNQAISDLTISINAEIQALSDAKASNNDAAVEQAVSNLKALNGQLQASVAPTQVASQA